MPSCFGMYALGVAIGLALAGRCLGQATVTSGYLEVDTTPGSIAPVAANLGRGLAGAVPMVAQAATGQTCPNCVPPVQPPASSFWHHPLFPLFRPRTAPPMMPSMPPSMPPSVPPETPPKKEPEKKEPEPKTPPSAETPTPEPTPTPAAGTETGPASVAFGNMFGGPFGAGGTPVTLPGLVTVGALSGPGHLSFPNTQFGLPSSFALIPVTVSANHITGTISNVGQIPAPVSPGAAGAYTKAAFGLPASQAQINTFLAAVTTPLIQPSAKTLPSPSPQTVALLVGQPSSVFYAAQLAEQSVHPGALLQRLTIANATVVPGSPDPKTATFAGNFSTVVLLFNPVATTIVVPDPAAGGVVGRYKPSEDANPLPRDRFIFNYDYFGGVPLGVGTDVNRFNIGFEKTFFGGLASIEARLPFAGTIASDIVLGNQITRLEIGDLRITPRLLVWNNRSTYVGIGMSMYLPTADAVRVAANDGTPLVRIPNSAFVMSPYIGVLYVPNNRLFVQAWTSCDFDTRGDPVYLNTGGSNLTYAGRLQDPANLSLDAQVGYWVYRSPNPNRFLTGVAPFVELHYGGNLAAPGLVSAGSIFVPSGTINQLNLTAGLSTRIGARSLVQFGAVVPLRTDDRPFGFQFGVRGNFFFGPNIAPPTFVSSF